MPISDWSPIFADWFVIVFKPILMGGMALTICVCVLTLVILKAQSVIYRRL